ncbi:MAG: oligosaccharide flippase family protein [Actinomycetota bacterium]|nr:oligosaccharide flippase family protein [Actinomycetota bacterium]
MADASGLIFGLLASVITARWLGPRGKGLFASLTLLSSVVVQLCTLGLGDAAIVYVGQKKVSIQRALASTGAVTVVAGLGGTAVVWVAAWLSFRRDWSDVRTGALIAALGVPVFLAAVNSSFLLSAEERIPASSAVLAMLAGAVVPGLLLFVVVVPLGVSGAMLASLVSATAAFALGAGLLSRSRLNFRPCWDSQYLKLALRYGISVQASYLLTVVFLRGDLLFVYSLAGPRAAGLYSVSLTGAALVSLLPIAISGATFPRLSRLEDEDANRLTAQLCRLGLVATLLSAVLLVPAIPIAVPLLFGSPFTPAVPATLILIAGSMIWSAQWLLCRARAARGFPGLLVKSFGLSLVTMCGLDLVLIPRFGINGAALASLAASCAGLLVCLAAFARSTWWKLPLTQLVPGWGDFRFFVTQPRRLLSRPGRTAEGS